MFFLFIRQLNEMLKYLFLNNQQDFFLPEGSHKMCPFILCNMDAKHEWSALSSRFKGKCLQLLAA